MRAIEEEALKNDAPQTAEAFDRQLLATPDSSLLWIKYIAFHLQVTDVHHNIHSLPQMAELEKARHVAEKALRIISYRQV